MRANYLYPFELKDDGCDIFPSCLSCPLPRCRYDSGFQGKTALRSIKVMKLNREGLTTRQISARLDLSLKTIYRILRNG